MTHAWPSPYCATPNNRLLVLDPGRGSEPDFIGGCPRGDNRQAARSELRIKQIFAAEIGKFPVTESLTPSLASWRNLIEFTTDFVVGHLEQHDFAAFSNSEPSTDVSKDRERILKVAGEGIATIGAYLAVIPEVYESKNDYQLGAELLTCAQKSKSFIVSWYSMHALDDLNLARALSIKTRGRHTNDDIFSDLAFDVKWFNLAEDGSVQIKEELLGRLTQSLATRRLSTGDRPLAVFGCPAARWIPAAYDMMVNLADANNLLETTYLKRMQRRPKAQTFLD